MTSLLSAPTSKTPAMADASPSEKARPSPPPAPKPSLLQRILPADIHSALTWRNLKILIRCELVLLGTLVLLLNSRSLQVIGQAAFFAAICACILPPNMAISLFIFAATTIVVGMCIGWAWGCAAMAAALRARSVEVSAAAYTRAQTAFASNPDGNFQAYVFQGYFLDPRSSAVYGVFFFIGTFAMGTIRAALPKLTILSVFGSIVMDVMCTYGPLFPSQQYTLATTFLIPTASYIAIALAGLALIFPETMAYQWLTSVNKGIFRTSISLFKLQNALLNSPVPLDKNAWDAMVGKSRAVRKGMIGAQQGIAGLTGFLDLEISYGRLGPGDLKTVAAKLRAMTGRAIAVSSFSHLVSDNLAADQDLGVDPSSTSTIAPNASSSHAGKFDPVKSRRRRMNELEARHGHDIDVLLPLLASTSASLRQACEDGLTGAADWYETINEKRWRRGQWKDEAEEVGKAKARVARLEAALKAFREEERHRLVQEPFGKFFNADTLKMKEEFAKSTSEVISPRSLFLCFVFTNTLEAYAETLLDFLSYTADLHAKRPRSRLWFPTGFGKLWRKISARSPNDGQAPLGGSHADSNETEPTTEEEDARDQARAQSLEKDDAPKSRDPDAANPDTPLQKSTSKLSAFFHFLGSPNGLFATRYALVSTAYFAFAAAPSTAGFAYENRGLWAVIMAQTALGVSVGEQVGTFFLRMGGTVIGLLVGTVAWYIGAGGLGNGNAIGVAAATMILVAPFLFARIVLPPQKMVLYLMAAVTTVLVVGYSWIDAGHLAVTVNAGIGIDIAWKRALLVIIGFAAAFLIMFFPKPTSARSMVRQITTKSLERTLFLFASEIDAYLLEEARSRHAVSEKAADDEAKTKRTGRMAERWIKIAGSLQSLEPLMGAAAIEPRLKGKWPKAKYEALIAAEWKLMVALSLLSGTFSRLDIVWTGALVHKTPFMNPNLLADTFTSMTLSARSLRHSHPLPSTTRSLRAQLLYHDSHRSRPVRLAEVDAEDHFDPKSFGLDTITLKTLTDPQLPIHATAAMALSTIYSTFDEITEIVRSLVGEASNFEGLREWQQLAARNEEEGRPVMPASTTSSRS